MVSWSIPGNAHYGHKIAGVPQIVKHGVLGRPSIGGVALRWSRAIGSIVA
jgi:hypothetical protein